MAGKHLSVLMVFGLACGGEEPLAEPEAPSSVLGPYATCDASRHLGGFEMSLRAGFTSVQGAVADGVRPLDVPEVSRQEGACQLLRPKTLFCATPCPGGETCGDDGQCVALPSNVSVGTVTVEGLSAPVEMEARAPIYFYNHVGALPHPGFVEGASLSLVATGADGGEAFAISSLGVAALEVVDETMAMERDTAGQLTWVPSTGDPSVRIEIELNIANHGGTPARVVCVAEDSGQFQIPATLINDLLDLGYSGFPSVALTRVSSNTADVGEGCVASRAQSEQVLAVEIPGLVSCSDSTDCPEGQACRLDLTCG
ncbi:MAG: hypothetical protein CMH55_09930 [Myxococcales bacterium]|nr:hypothetical protein [Myxococcales bacterium]